MHLGTHPESNQSIEHLDRVVAGQDAETEEGHDKTENIGPEDEATGTRARESAFANHFTRVIDEVATAIAEQSTPEGMKPNPHYSPTTVAYLVMNYFHILPLWTGLLLRGSKHDTNSPAGNWMKILKNDILGGKKRLTPSNFIIETRASLKGRLREFQDRGRDTHQKKQRSQKRQEKSSFMNSEEKRGGKKKKKGIYFDTPAKVKPLRATLITTASNKDFEGAVW